MTALVTTILAMLTVFNDGPAPVYAYHLRMAHGGPEARAEDLAWQLEEASTLAGVDLALLTALAYHESAFDHGAVATVMDDKPRVAGEGFMQLNPQSRWGRSWRKDCTNAHIFGPDAGVCEDLNVQWGALALRDALTFCKGDVTKAIGFYRTGKCVAGPKGQATVRLSWWIAWRLKHPSAKPMVRVKT